MTADAAPTRDTAPRSVKIVAPTRSTRDQAPRAKRKKSLEKPLVEFFTTVGTTLAMVNQADGIAIVQGAERLAAALNNVAKDNATVYRNLERMLTGSAWGGVFIAAGSIALPILANHNLLPFQIPGVQIPETEPANVESVPPLHPDFGPDSATG